MTGGRTAEWQGGWRRPIAGGTIWPGVSGETGDVLALRARGGNAMAGRTLGELHRRVRIGVPEPTERIVVGFCRNVGDNDDGSSGSCPGNRPSAFAGGVGWATDLGQSPVARRPAATVCSSMGPHGSFADQKGPDTWGIPVSSGAWLRCPAWDVSSVPEPTEPTRSVGSLDSLWVMLIVVGTQAMAQPPGPVPPPPRSPLWRPDGCQRQPADR